MYPFNSFKNYLAVLTSSPMMTENINTEEVFASLDHTTSEFIELLSSFTETQVNEIPWAGSWTAAQVAEHVTLSNIGIIKSLRKEGRSADRAADAGVEGLKKTFLDFDTKLQSPEFILPTRDIYQRKLVIESLGISVAELKKLSRHVNLFEIISHPIFGDITKLELIHFVVYHTQRHVQQLKNILAMTGTKVKSKTRSLLAFMHVSLDGFVANRRGEMDWITIDDEIFKDAIALADIADTALFGRVTYQMMESYWPTVLSNDSSTKLELQHAQWMQNASKIVVSSTLDKVDWNNTRLIKGNIAREILELKHRPGKNIMIFGSPGLTHSLMQWDLIDEYRININPVILGGGIPLFSAPARINLKLMTTKNFKSGVVGLHYKTIN
jgi:dihydrofolate reductase